MTGKTTDKDYKGYFYVTTPIYYVNDNPHIGHAYSTVIADSIARFKRLSGYKVFFLTGTDEHGLKIEKEANVRGISPKELADAVHIKFDKLFDMLSISYNRFIRTTDEDHIKTVQLAFSMLMDKGDIYLSEYEGWYCTPCETFLTEKSLAEGGCPQCGRSASRVKEESYFLKLSKYEKRLTDYINSHPEFIKPSFRRNEVLSFIKDGLNDLSISRTSFSWGIPVPGNDKHIIYVWFDALLNYLSAIGFEEFHKGAQNDFNLFFETANHIVGKDILKFHAIYWPIMLFALDLPLPKTVFAHGWWLMNNRKMSKSLGNVIDPIDLINNYGTDSLRFYLLREVTIGLDGGFNVDNFITRYNSELANDLGNLVSRTTAMLRKFTDGNLPDFETGVDENLVKSVHDITNGLNERYDNYDFAKILEDIFRFIGVVNKYINDSAPWKIDVSEREGRAQLHKILRTAIISIYCISYLIYPFMPDTSAKINEILNVKSFESFQSPITPENIFTGHSALFGNGHKISENRDILFPKIT